MGREVLGQDDSAATVPEGFTLALALVDALPVAFFCASCIVFGEKLQSPVFVAGTVVAALGGAGKVCWKLVIALAHKNVPLLSRQMRYVMPVGFALMAAGVVLAGAPALELLAALGRMPSVALLAVWVACMCAMGYFAGHRDQGDARSNWIEQLTNAAGQAALLAALLLT